MGSTRAAAALIDAHRPERALSELAPVLAAHPDDSDALRLAAIASARCGRGHDAVEFAQSAIRVAPDDIGVQTALVEALLADRQAMAALAVARRLAEQHPRNGSLLALFVEVAASTGDHSRRTLKVAQTAVALSPLDPSTHHALGRLYTTREETRRARRAFEQALRLDPDHDAARFNLTAIRAGGLDLMAGARDFADLGATSSDRERDVAAATGVLAVAVYVSALFIAFASSVVAAFMGEPFSYEAARWMLAAAAVAFPVLTVLWARMRLGRHAGALFSELRRRRFATVVAAALVPLSAVAWIVAAARPSTGPLWYNLAMLPGVLAAIVTVVSGSFRRGR